MERMIERLVDRFTAGQMSRRELVQGLAFTAVAAATGCAEPSDSRLTAVGVNHISYNVRDYARTRDFYADLFGMEVSHDNGDSSCYLKFGDSFMVVRHESGENPPGSVDHIAYTIGDYDRLGVEAELSERGFEPQPDSSLSWTIEDPDGVTVQISSRAMLPGNAEFERAVMELRAGQGG